MGTGIPDSLDMIEFLYRIQKEYGVRLEDLAAITRDDFPLDLDEAAAEFHLRIGETLRKMGERIPRNLWTEVQLIVQCAASDYKIKPESWLIFYQIEKSCGIGLDAADWDSVAGQRKPADMTVAELHFLVGAKLSDAGKPVPPDLGDDVQSILATTLGARRHEVKPESWLVKELGMSCRIE